MDAAGQTWTSATGAVLILAKCVWYVVLSFRLPRLPRLPFLIRTHPKHVLYSSRPGLSISRTRVRLFLSSLASTGLSQRINVPEKSIS